MAKFFEALPVSYKNSIEIVPVCGIGKFTYELFHAAVSCHFKIKNSFRFVHQLSGAEIKKSFFLQYVKRYEHNLILVVKEQPELPTTALETQPVEFIIKDEPQCQEILLENISMAADSDDDDAIECDANENDMDFEPTPRKLFRAASCSDESEDSVNYRVNNENLRRKLENIREIIMTSEKETLARYIQNPKSLTNLGRVKISKAIINHLLNEEPELVLRVKQFEKISKMILSIFDRSTESADVYYTPAQNGRPAKGKLFNAYHNKKHSLAKAGLIRRRKLVSRKKNSNPQTTTTTAVDSNEECSTAFLEQNSS